ncbi:MAG: flagellar basal body P-ring formation chaperone FlgA [Gemmatimonadota bacterium]
MTSFVDLILLATALAAQRDTTRGLPPARLDAGLRTAVATVWGVEPGRVRVDWGRGMRLNGLPDSAAIALTGRGDRGWFVASLNGARPLTVRAGIMKTVWVTRRALRAGATLGAGELTLDERVVWGPPVEILRESLIGRELRRDIVAGGEVEPAALAQPVAVRAGEPVWLVYAKGAVNLRVEAIANGPARLGEIVRATDRRRGVALQGIMTGPGTARLVETGRTR